jgi:hypothetical protein
MEVAAAATGGRVSSLLVEADRHVPGTIGDATGMGVGSGDHTDPVVDDLLDDVTDRVLRSGGQVCVLPSGQMPSATGVAAVFQP